MPNTRPFYSRLPSETPNVYQGNSIVDWLGAYWDDLYYDCQSKLKDLPRQFDPELCDIEYLDFLAPLCGFSSRYWDEDYPTNAKRLLLKNAFTKVWNNKGTTEQLSFVLDALNIEHKIITPGSFIVGEGQLNISPLGSGGWQFRVILPIKYNMGGAEYLLCKNIVELFAPCWCEWAIEQEVITNANDIVLLAVDGNTLLDANNRSGVWFSNSDGTFRNTSGTFRNPNFNQEETNIRIK